MIHACTYIYCTSRWLDVYALYLQQFFHLGFWLKIFTVRKLVLEYEFTQSSASSSSMVGISTTSSLRANLPRILGLLSANVFLHAYFFFHFKKITNQNKVIKNFKILRNVIRPFTFIVLVKFLWLRLALYFEIFSLRSSAL